MPKKGHESLLKWLLGACRETWRAMMGNKDRCLKAVWQQDDARLGATRLHQAQPEKTDDE